MKTEFETWWEEEEGSAKAERLRSDYGVESTEGVIAAAKYTAWDGWNAGYQRALRAATAPGDSGTRKPLSIQVGKTYKDGIGNRHRIICDSGNKLWPFTSDSDRSYTGDGMYGYNPDSVLNLVEEIRE